MRTIDTSKTTITELLAESEKSHEPIHLIGKNNEGVLIAMDDWEAIQETLFLLSISKMRASIVRELKTPVAACSPNLEW